MRHVMRSVDTKPTQEVQTYSVLLVVTVSAPCIVGRHAPETPSPRTHNARRYPVTDTCGLQRTPSEIYVVECKLSVHTFRQNKFLFVIPLNH